LPRKKKQDIKINDSDSLSGLIQETYNDACLQINDTQKIINELSAGVTPADVDEHAKIAKEKGGLLKIKDSAIRIKLEIAKLQSDIIKNSGDISPTISERSDGTSSLDDFKYMRNLLKNGGVDKNEDE